MRYVSTHPMFGPTFANLGSLNHENAIVINEGDYMGASFSATYTVGSDYMSANIRSRNTTRPWPTRSVFLSCRLSPLLR